MARGGLLSDILPRSSVERISDLEKEIAELRTRISEVIMPEIELRATLRLTPDLYWDWLFDELKKTPSSAEQLHWISFMTRLHKDMRRRSISSNLIVDLFNFLMEEQVAMIDSLSPETSAEYKLGYTRAFNNSREAFLKFVAKYPKLHEKFEEYLTNVAPAKD